jgi:hypothetical protein
MVDAEGPEQLAAFDGNGVELVVGVTVLAVVGVGSAAQTEEAGVFGAQVVDHTAVPMPITAMSTTAAIARRPYVAGTRSGAALPDAGPLSPVRPGGRTWYGCRGYGWPWYC